MGEQFAFAFDVAVIVILAVFTFVGLKRGFAKVVLGLVSTLAAFACAMLLSGPIAESVYKNHIEKTIEGYLDESDNKVFGEFKLGGIADIDFDKVKINGTKADDVELDYAGTRKAVVDLSRLDLSETGLTKADLVKIGITDDSGLGALNAKTAEFSMDNVREYGLGKLAVAQYIAVNLSQLTVMKSFDSLAEKISKYIPSFSGSASADSTGVTAIRAVTLKMFDMGGSFKDAVMNGIVEPNCTLFIRTVVFFVIFVLVNVILRILTSVLKLVGKIPVIGKINSLLGAVLGLAEGLFAVFVVCLITRMIVSLGGANSILFNQAAIDSTFVFKLFYNFDFLNFLT